jgi:hypothetical protein
LNCVVTAPYYKNGKRGPNIRTLKAVQEMMERQIGFLASRMKANREQMLAKVNTHNPRTEVNHEEMMAMLESQCECLARRDDGLPRSSGSLSRKDGGKPRRNRV